jgi:hypothetical protein
VAPRGSSRPDGWDGSVEWRSCLRLGLLGFAFSLGLVLLAVAATPDPPPNATEGGYTTPYTPPRDRFEVMLNHADGQAYATLAQDPTLARPNAFVGGPASAANFGARPVLPYLLYAGSLGRAAWIPFPFVLIQGLAGGIVVAGAAAVLHAAGRRSEERLALAVLLLPGAQLGIVLLGQDLLGLGLTLLGLVLFVGRRSSPLLAAMVLTVAGLTRETMLIAVAVALLHEWWRRGPRRRDGWMALPFVAYAGWNQFSAHRFGATSGAGVANNLAWPFTGIAQDVGRWSTIGLVVVVTLLAFVVVSLIWRTDELLTWLVAAYLAATTISAEPVWRTWQSGVRVSLPLAAFALLNVRLPPRLLAIVRRSGIERIPVA